MDTNELAAVDMEEATPMAYGLQQELRARLRSVSRRAIRAEAAVQGVPGIELEVEIAVLRRHIEELEADYSAYVSGIGRND